MTARRIIPGPPRRAMPHAGFHHSGSVAAAVSPSLICGGGHVLRAEPRRGPMSSSCRPPTSDMHARAVFLGWGGLAAGGDWIAEHFITIDSTTGAVPAVLIFSREDRKS